MNSWRYLYQNQNYATTVTVYPATIWLKGSCLIKWSSLTVATCSETLQYGNHIYWHTAGTPPLQLRATVLSQH